MKESDYPSHSRCIELLKEQKTPKNIFLHSRKVNAISMFIADILKKKGAKIDIGLIDKASLLHDIEKYHSLKNHFWKHTYEGYNTLIIRGYPKIARVVLKHGLDTVLETKYGLTEWEDIVVYYADKRVNNDKIVSLRSRISYLKKKYGKISKKILDKIKSVEKPLYECERQIFKNLGLKPGRINEASIRPFLIGEEY